MSYTVTKYPHGTFSWADVMSKDIKKSKEFMTKLMGWTSEDMPTGMPGVDYTMFAKDGYAVAGGSPMMPGKDDMPSAWASYITVDSADEIGKKAESLGASIVMPVMDVMTAGRMVGILDPTGAFVIFWEPKEHIGAGLVNTVGAMGWNELRTHDLEKAKNFYKDLLNWSFKTDRDGYEVIINNGRMNGGMMQMEEEWAKIPSHWVPYFTVKSAEETVKRVKELGGSVMMDKIIEAPGVGKFVMVEDPAGANFVAIEMDDEPDHWEE